MPSSERFFVERVIAAAGPCCGQLLGTAVQCRFGIGTFSNGRFLADIGWRAGVVFAGAVCCLLDQRPAVLLNQHLGGGGEKRGGFLGGDRRQVFTAQLRPRLAAVPAVRLAGAGMNPADDDLLAGTENLDLVGGAVGGGKSGRRFCKRHVGTKQQNTLGRHADAHRGFAQSILG